MADAPNSLSSLAAFRGEFPWPKRVLDLGKPLEWLWDFDMTVTGDQLWPHLVDTSRLNRALGLREMAFEEIDGVLHGSSVNGGVVHQWIEEPWTWVAGKSLTAVRTYSRGFARVARVILQVVEDNSRSRVRVYFGWIPRGVIGWFAIRLGMPGIKRAYGRVLGELQRDIAKRKPTPYIVPAEELPPPTLQRVTELREQLRDLGIDDDILARLVELLESGDNLDLYRIQPRKLAREWQAVESELLAACLHATRVGLLDLSWDVICPHCRGVREESSSLSSLASTGSCDVCEIDFSTDLENTVEVTFHVHASIRDVPKLYFCSAEPATKSHIKVQQLLEAGETKTVEATLTRGRYRVRIPGNQIAGYVDATDDGDEQLCWQAGNSIDEAKVTPNVAIELVNTSEESALFVIEEVRWADEALRPSRLFALQEFRDLFSEEYLGSDVRLSVGEQTLMFTDMVGSTAFYRKNGDPTAFIKVKGHFASVFGIINDCGGAVVKTIGDAVMAVFPNPLDAVKAAGKINLAFPTLESDADAIRLRVSLNSGPCIAVNLNTGIDYFGGTVNTAAKLQACAEAGEVALSRRVYDAPGVSEYLRDSNASFEERSIELQSLEVVDYVFWRVS